MSNLIICFFMFYRHGDHRDLHSFPTRRSSDLSRLVNRKLPMTDLLTPLADTMERNGFAFVRAPEMRLLLEEAAFRSEEHTSELQSRPHLVCRLLLEKKKTNDLRRSHELTLFFY